jgi:flagellar motor switch protein FliN/FliY
MAQPEQCSVEDLLSQAATLAHEAQAHLATPNDAPAPPPSPTAAQDPQLARILRLKVPVIVQLAQRPMSIATVRNLSVGSILEFNKSVDEELDLLIANRRIGRGNCVKVGENFGLRITQICDKAQRIRSMGPT